MSNIDKRALREAAEKATKGEWWSDVVETDGEYGEGEDRVSGYHSYAVYVGHESLLDMTNSTAACIHTEWDHDYHMAWDETAKRNAEFIATANPATVLALLDELEAAENRINRLEAIVAVAEQRNALMREWKRALKVPCDLVDDQVPVVIHGMVIRLERLKETEAKLEVAEKRIAELEAKKVTIKLPESFYPDGNIDCPLVINEYQIIEAIVAADCKPIAVCPRCKSELDLTHKPDGAHYCHAAAGKGE